MRTEPARLRPGTLSVISLRLDYLPQDAADAQATLDDGDRAYISRYALGRDYHKLLRSRLKKLAERIAAAAPHGYRVFADSAPILEKALARNANLGWIGKHTLLLNRQAGSWFFLGEIFTDLPLPADPRPVPRNHCGSCSACIEICPTRAITGPQQLDARRCISYLTIEHRGSIPLELRSAIGNRIFGCDDCQLVCPWNQYAKLSSDPAFAPRHGLDRARLVELSGWGEDEWLRKTEGMALRRAGYAGFLRNVAVALGNAPTSAAVVAALTRLTTADPIVREHADWALQRHSAAKAG
jgi:epoxyqueuosine reductase